MHNSQLGVHTSLAGMRTCALACVPECVICLHSSVAYSVPVYCEIIATSHWCIKRRLIVIVNEVGDSAGCPQLCHCINNAMVGHAEPHTCKMP